MTLKAFAFLLGLSTYISFVYFGEWILVDFFAVGLLVFTVVFFFRYQTWTRETVILLLLLATYPVLIGIIDSYHNVYPIYSLKQMGKFALIIPATLLFYYAFTKTSNFLIYYLFGRVLGSVYNYINPSIGEDKDLAIGYLSDTYLVSPILTSVSLVFTLLVASRSKLAALILLLLFIFGQVAFLQLPRSSYLPYLGLLGLLSLSVYIGLRKNVTLDFKQVFFRVGLVIAATMVLFYSLYVVLAPEGYLGDMQRAKFAAQSQSRFGNSPLGLIGVGRFQVFVGFFAFLDSPWIGHGSYNYNAFYIHDAAFFLGISSTQAYEKFAGRGTHSAAVQGLSSYGFLAGFFWIGIYWAVIQAAVVSTTRFLRGHWADGFILFTSVAMMWSLLFSPFLGGNRMSLALLLAYVLAFAPRAKQKTVRSMPNRPNGFQ